MESNSVPLAPTQSIDRANASDGPQAAYRFTNEEMRVLRQCNKESFYQRSLPLSTALSVGTYFAVKSGYLKSHPRFGPTPKVLVAATIGYCIGKFSYQSKCAEKLMQLPNSQIGEMLRQRKKQGGTQETFAEHSSLAWPEFQSVDETNRNLEIDRPVMEGLDDSFRPTLDSPAIDEEVILIPAQQNTSYEELRQRNREEYEKRGRTVYRASSSSDGFTPSSPVSRVDECAPEFRPISRARPGPKNKYGDEWEV